MSDSQQKPWSDNPNAPKISYLLYHTEKTRFAGTLISLVLHGIVTVLFCKCIAALFNPIYRRGERIKWGLVSYTTVMFSLATVQIVMNLDIQSIPYIDDRGFPGVKGMSPGPFGYQEFISTEALSIVPNAMIGLTGLLADGLLLHRCYIIYSKNPWVIAFPCLMYLGSAAMGMILVYQCAVPSAHWSSLPYFSISLSLNVLLTLMIVIRLILCARNTRNAMGISGIGGLCNAIVTMLIESCAVFAVNSTLVLILMGGENTVENVFLFTLPEIQVIAPLFVIHRVASKSALTSKSLVSGYMSTFKMGSRGELTDGSGAVPGGNPASSVDERGVNTGEPRVVVATTYDSKREEAY